MKTETEENIYIYRQQIWADNTLNDQTNGDQKADVTQKEAAFTAKCKWIAARKAIYFSGRTEKHFYLMTSYSKRTLRLHGRMTQW